MAWLEDVLNTAGLSFSLYEPEGDGLLFSCLLLQSHTKAISFIVLSGEITTKACGVHVCVCACYTK